MLQLVRRSFSTKMGIFIVAILISFSTFNAIITYQYAKQHMAESLTEHILAVVNSAFHALDGDKFMEIFWDFESEYEDKTLLLETVGIIKNIQQVNNLKIKQNHSPLYTLTKSCDVEQNRDLALVALANKNTEHKYFTGYLIYPSFLRMRVSELIR